MKRKKLMALTLAAVTAIAPAAPIMAEDCSSHRGR